MGNEIQRDLTLARTRYAAADRSLARQYQISSRGHYTWKNDKFSWQDFSNYLGPADPWKASPDDIAAYIASLAERNYNPRTIARRLSSLRFYYNRLGKGFEQGAYGIGIRKDDPVNTEVVRATMQGIKNVHGRPKVKKVPIMLDSLEKMITRQPDNLRGIRNRALLCLGWAAAARPSDLSGLDIAPNGDGNGFLEFRTDGLIVIFRRRKYLQPEDGLHRIAIPARPSAPIYCPLTLVKHWIDAAGFDQGPLFRGIYNRCNKARPNRMHVTGIKHAIKSAVATIGLPPDQYSGKSLRSGCITWMMQEGVRPLRIMEHSGHKHIKTMQAYVLPTDAIENSPLARTSWMKSPYAG